MLKRALAVVGISAALLGGLVTTAGASVRPTQYTPSTTPVVGATRAEVNEVGSTLPSSFLAAVASTNAPCAVTRAKAVASANRSNPTTLATVLYWSAGASTYWAGPSKWTETATNPTTFKKTGETVTVPATYCESVVTVSPAVKVPRLHVVRAGHVEMLQRR